MGRAENGALNGSAGNGKRPAADRAAQAQPALVGAAS